MSGHVVTFSPTVAGCLDLRVPSLQSRAGSPAFSGRIETHQRHCPFGFHIYTKPYAEMTILLHCFFGHFFSQSEFKQSTQDGLLKYPKQICLLSLTSGLNRTNILNGKPFGYKPTCLSAYQNVTVDILGHALYPGSEIYGVTYHEV